MALKNAPSRVINTTSQSSMTLDNASSRIFMGAGDSVEIRFYFLLYFESSNPASRFMLIYNRHF